MISKVMCNINLCSKTQVKDIPVIEQVGTVLEVHVCFLWYTFYLVFFTAT